MAATDSATPVPVPERGRAADAQTFHATRDALRGLIRSNPFGLIVVDEGLRIEEASRGAEQALAAEGPLAGQALDAVLARRLSPRWAARAAQRLRQVMATGVPYRTPSHPAIDDVRTDAPTDPPGSPDATGQAVALDPLAVLARHGFAFAFDLRIDRIRLPDGRVGAACHFYDLSERRRLEASLRESEDLFRAMADSLPLIVWVHDAQGRQVWVNETFCGFFGIRREQLGAGGWTALPHPDDGPAYVAAFARAVREQAPFHGELRVQDAHGRWRWLESWGRPRFGAKGEFLGHVGTSADVTERKATEQALVEERDLSRRQHTELELIYRTAPVGLCMVDRSLRFVRINDRLASINGRAAEEHLGRTVAEIVPDVADTVSTLMRSVLETGRPVIDVEVVSASGAAPADTRSFLVSYVPVRTAQNEVAGVAGVVHETTVQQAMERALRDSERRFRGLAETMPHGVWVSDETGHNTYHNATWLAYTGQRREDALGSGWLAHCHPDDQAPLLEMWARARGGPVARPYDTEVRFRRHDGEYRWFRVTGAPVTGDGGAVVRWVGTVSDIHEQRLLMSALRDADRRKDAFLATLAHELRNPLAAVTHAAMLLQRRELSDDHRSWASEVILRQSRQLGRLIDDLMDVSRVTVGRIELRREPVDLREVLQTAAETSRPALNARQQHFELSLPSDGALTVQGDVARLVQIFQNLLSNAAKYTPAGGQVTLAARRLDPEAQVEVRVRDDGVGLRAEDLPRIFEMFAQVAEARDLSEGGLGIGLYLVRRLAQLHGGTVEAASAGPGQGSEFVVRLPLWSAPATPGDLVPADHGARDASASTPGRRVLVADDSQDTRRSLSLLLESAGCEVRVARDGREAVDLALAFMPDLVLLDLGMPGMNGFQAAAELRADPRGRGLRLVALTGWGQPEDRARSRAAGFDEHLIKPAELPALLALIASDRPHRASDA